MKTDMFAPRLKGGIVEVQHLRAIAVLLVVFAHLHQANARFFATPLLGDATFAGFSGVDIFFVISGFIIHHLYRNRARPDAVYYLKRANRIYPLYWIFTGLALVGYAVMGDQLTADAADIDIAGSLSLVPLGHPPVLVVGWTLTHELYFYLVYGLWLALPERLRPVAAAGWALVTLGALAFDLSSQHWLRLVVSPFNLLFLAGALIATAYHRYGLKNVRLAAAFVLAIGAALAAFWAERVGLEGIANPPVRVFVFFPLAVGAVATLLAWRPALPDLVARIGDWSYSIYLGHILVIGLLARLLGRWMGDFPLASPLLYLTGLIACILCGAVSYHLLERPLLKLGRRGIDRLRMQPARHDPH